MLSPRQAESTFPRIAHSQPKELRPMGTRGLPGQTSVSQITALRAQAGKPWDALETELVSPGHASSCDGGGDGKLGDWKLGRGGVGAPQRCYRNLRPSLTQRRRS